MGSELTRIAYVEDEPDIRDLTRLALETFGGFELAVYEDGEKALANISKFAPDLVLLDVMMPGMDGPEVFRQLAAGEETSALPVVFMTAKTQRQELEEFIELGAVGVISKPYDPFKLPDELRGLWQKAIAA